MNFKNFTIKLFSSILMLFVAQITLAQDQTVSLGDATLFNYTVDTSSDPSNPTLNNQPNGTNGSTYTWTISPTSGAIITTTVNKATINWSATPVGTYTVKVIETNDSCPPVEVEFTVEITLPISNATVSWTSVNICKGEEVIFEVVNAIPGSTLHFTSTNTTVTTGTVLVEANGTAKITVTHDGTDNDEVVLTLNKMVLNGNDITITPTVYATATINIIKTSPILLQ